MLTIKTNDLQRYCDGLTRRSFLQAGYLGLGGLGLADLLRLKAQAKAGGRSSHETAVILVWLDGGPPHIDTSRTFTDHTGRPHQVLAKGAPIAELI